MNIWDQEKYIKAWNFASRVHNGQLVPGTDIPYINHIGSVAMEAMAAIAYNKEIKEPDLLVQCALLHDVIEDTNTPYEVLEIEFGADVADGVLALSKNKNIGTKEEQMKDSLEKIKQQPVEVWMVKLSDRITNLQPPPAHWSMEKIKRYRDEAVLILEVLGRANTYLAHRLRNKISDYGGLL